MKIAVLCPSEIALRRFMPALQSSHCFDFFGIGKASPEEWFGSGISSVSAEEIENQKRCEKNKTEVFVSRYGGKVFDSYEETVSAPGVDAVYIPLPPALHFRWARMALDAGKHVLVEKPVATALAETREMIALARRKRIALHENYMFVFHRQIEEIETIIGSGEIGAIRLIRISFGFPRRAANDFRYDKKLGGGALLDCGGYTIRYASHLLGPTARLTAAQANFTSDCSVDMYGSATMVNDDGTTAQLAFGMDNNYKCDLEVWGSSGTLFTGRVLTAPAGFVPTVEIQKGNERVIRSMSADDSFQKSIMHFKSCIADDEVREKQYAVIDKQAALIEKFRELSAGHLSTE